ncbi:MAG: molybdenum cofactor biosynthesis protein MoaB [Myxococcales bacterium]|nr:molybdenum cofactor biosynthesis protein MoaB [Myxococcales bacterium]
MGHEEHKKHAPRVVRVFVITVSDTRTQADDTGGALARALCAAAGHTIAGSRILKDEPAEVAALIRDLAERRATDVILTTGGTGISLRDSTYEAVAALLDKRLDGFGELFRMLSYQAIGPSAMLSRAVAGVHRGVVVFALPGSPAAVRLALEKLIVPELGHLAFERGR